MRVRDVARCAVRVVGVGSPHGDDRAGWLVAGCLAKESALDAGGPGDVEVTSAGDPLRLVGLLEGCTRLIVVDACRSGLPAGTVVGTTWAEVRRGTAGAPGADAGPSSHGLGVVEALALAEALGKLTDPAAVAIVGIEADDGVAGPAAEPSAAVRDAVPAACRLVRELIGGNVAPGDSAAPGRTGGTTGVAVDSL